MSSNSNTWSFDVSSFMVLVGEAEEFNYRLMRRSLIECLTAAPVAGLQSYMRSNYSLLEKTGLSYFSPRGCNSALLRNMRLEQSIRCCRLLQDGYCKVYQIPTSSKRSGCNSRVNVAAVISWIVFIAILVFIFSVDEVTWIGVSACVCLTGWSLLLRLGERLCIQPAPMRPSQPDELDTIYILGRKNSCFILQGSRRDVMTWTSQGLEQRKEKWVELVCVAMRIGSLAMLVFILIVIPNGTMLDQVAFIVLNVLGQWNVMLGQHLNAQACLSELQEIGVSEMPTRTHAYAYLLRRFGNGSWVDKGGLLPKTDVWAKWRDAVAENVSVDAKEQYDKCVAAERVEEIIVEPKQTATVKEVEIIEPIG